MNTSLHGTASGITSLREKPAGEAKQKPPNFNFEEPIQEVKDVLWKALLQFTRRHLDPREPEEKYAALDKVLEKKKSRFRIWYLETLVNPFEKYLKGKRKGASEIDDVEDLLIDTILQNGIQKPEHLALQEVINDLYDGFLSEEDLKKISRSIPERGSLPPLVTLSSEDKVLPRTYGPKILKSFGVSAQIIRVPESAAHGGGLAWVTLAHETCGHGILNAFEGLLGNLRNIIYDRLEEELGSNEIDRKRVIDIVQYWDYGYHEMISDCMGVLNLGPAMVVGALASFRAQAAFKKDLEERSDKARSPDILKDDGDKGMHPSNFLRILLMARLTGRLKFSKNSEWQEAIETELFNDVPIDSGIGRWKFTENEVNISVNTIVGIIADQGLNSLNNMPLTELQNWTDEDENIVARLRSVLRNGFSGQQKIEHNSYAAHALAAYVMEAIDITNTHPPGLIFKRMNRMLVSMYGMNRSAGTMKRLGDQCRRSIK